MHQSDDLNTEYKVELATWKKIIKIVFSSKKKLLLLIIPSSAVAILEGIIPLVNRYAIDQYFIKNDFSTWPYFVVVNLLIAIAFGVSLWGFIYQAGIIEADTSYELRRQAFKNIQRLSFSFFDKTPQGWVMARMTSDARKLSMIISWGVIDFVWATLSMITILVVLYITYFKLAIIVTIAVPIMFAIAFAFRKLILKQHRLAKKHNSQLTAQYSEGFLGAKTTKSLSIEDKNFDEFKYTAHNLKRASIKAVISSALFSSLLLIVAYIAVGTTMYQGSIFVLELAITVGTLQMFIAYTINFFEPIMAISRVLADLQNAQASAERIVQLIETKPEITDRADVESTYGTLFSDKVENWENLKGKVEFRDVSFYYLKNEMILNHFNLTVEPGQSVALVGHTGSGKTTIVNLLARFYEPKAGKILIDDKDYKSRSIHWLHKRLGYVLQSPHLFSTSVLENIRYGRIDATDEEVILAAKMVGVDDFVSNLDEGYHTLVGEDGNLLSIGQKQLISFARAILADPKILILDEATSSIDSESELVIQKATDKLLEGRTSFIIAHRLSTIVKSDVIIMLDMGKIIEMGTHDQLIAKKGAYFNLYKNQFIKENENI